jgi:hypothetical protein
VAAFTAAAVKPISRSQRNGGFGADSGPSRGGPCKGAIHPTEPFTPPPREVGFRRVRRRWTRKTRRWAVSTSHTRTSVARLGSRATATGRHTGARSIATPRFGDLHELGRLDLQHRHQLGDDISMRLAGRGAGAPQLAAPGFVCGRTRDAEVDAPCASETRTQRATPLPVPAPQQAALRPLPLPQGAHRGTARIGTRWKCQTDAATSRQPTH